MPTPALFISPDFRIPRPISPFTGKPILIIDLYCRISKDYDGTTRSVASQEVDCRGAVADHEEDGWVVGKVFRDHALSGWNPKVNRPDWNQLMERLESGASDGLMVYDMSRFTRKPIEGERLIIVAERGLIIASIENTYNLMSASGRATFRNDMTAAAKESDLISQRSSRGKKNKVAQGRSNASRRGYGQPGYDVRPAGWVTGDPLPPLVSDEQVQFERGIIREMAQRLLSSERAAWIIRDLDERGIRTVNGNPWTADLMKQMLRRRPSITGLLTYRREIIGEEANLLDPILDRDTYDAVCRLYDSRPPGRPATQYILSGILGCAECGYKLYGRPQSSRPPYADGEPARQYWCMPRPPVGGCGKVAIDQRFADAVVKEAVLFKLSDPDHLDRLAAYATSVSKERVPLESKLRELAADRLAVADKIGTRGLVWVERATDSIDAEVARVEDSLAKLDVVNQPTTIAARAVEEWTQAEKRGDIGTLRRMVAEAFPSMALKKMTDRKRDDVTRFVWDKSTAAT